MPLAPEVMEQIHAKLSKQFNRPVSIIKNTLDMFNQGNTVPFIARYRKDVTKELDEVALRDLQKENTSCINLEERRATIINSIQDQGKLTPELADRVLQASTLTELEDIYLPFKPKRQTKAQKAREAGLEPLADIIMKQQPGEGEGNKIAML
nr:Tex-like N-terminal domain-containing protein [Candidatus Sigynarchaeota archaeon]